MKNNLKPWFILEWQNRYILLFLFALIMFIWQLFHISDCIGYITDTLYPPPDYAAFAMVIL